MSIMKTLVGEHMVAGCLIRLKSDANEDGSHMWVDFWVIDPLWTEPNGRLCFQTKGAMSSPTPTYDPDNAEAIAEGFCKWDGCTQFTSDVHVDDRNHLYRLLSAILEARKLSAEFMGHIIGTEYGPDPAETL